MEDGTSFAQLHCCFASFITLVLGNTDNTMMYLNTKKVSTSKVLPEPHGPSGGADLRFHSPQPDTSLYAARPRIRGQCIAWCVCLLPSRSRYQFILLGEHISQYQKFTILVSCIPRYFFVPRHQKYRDTFCQYYICCETFHYAFFDCTCIDISTTLILLQWIFLPKIHSCIIMHLWAYQWHQGGPKTWHNFLYTLTSSKIN